MNIYGNHSDCLHCVSCVFKCSSFKVLTDNDLETFNKNKIEVKLKPGEVIFKQGTKMTHILTFTSGIGKIYIEGFNDRDLILKLVKPTEMIASPGMYVGGCHTFSVAAITKSTVCLIDIDLFKQFLHQDTQFADAFMHEFASRFILTFQKFMSMMHKQMHGRIAESLLYLSEQIYESPIFDVVLSRQELADISGLSKESVCRILKEFQKEGIINTKGNHYEILNISILQQISRNG